ncbi:MAG: molecular chaperone HtpG [Chlamydiae bacterium]|nr:molecular chaperone HtpG [Chlamydiota bacterium]
MNKKKLQVHTENILPIIKKWLYSDKDIFVRELVSNACDALSKCKTLRDEGLLSVNDDELKIELFLSKEDKTLRFVDTGLGMNAEEVEKYISQLAFSGAEEFVSKYKSDNEKEQIIGHFGLGFYSAYMVATHVTIDTLSYQEGSVPTLWSCDGGIEYDLSTGVRAARGTDITLHIGEDSEEFLEEHKIRSLLEQYCSFLPYPIYLNGTHINKKDPLWLKAPSQCTEEEYLEFYRALYPMDPDPLFWIHLNVDYPFHLKGILYFPKITKRFDWNQSSIKLFCNRVFVSDNCKDLIPDYLMVLKGAIDSPDIPLNVSRSYLQMDRTVRQLSTHVSKKIADKLDSLYSTEKEKFTSSWSDIELIVKLGVLQDDKFYEKAKEFLIWKTASGDWITTEEYVEKTKDKGVDKIFYTSGDPSQESHFLHFYKENNIEVIYSTSPVDTHLMNFLEGKIRPTRFQRIDGGLDDSLLDASKENTLLDADGKTAAARLADFIRSSLESYKVEVEAKSLASTSLPGFILVDEDLRRMRDTLALSQQSFPSSMMDKKTFIVNTNSKLMSALPHMQHKSPELAKDLVQQIYELSLLSQRELEPAKLSEFIQRSTRVLEQLVETNYPL